MLTLLSVVCSSSGVMATTSDLQRSLSPEQQAALVKVNFVRLCCAEHTLQILSVISAMIYTSRCGIPCVWPMSVYC